MTAATRTESDYEETQALGGYLVETRFGSGPSNSRFLAVVLLLLALSGFIVRRIDAPGWIGVALTVAWLVVLPWIAWTFIKEWRSSRREGSG
jgi:hypothetical protein